MFPEGNYSGEASLSCSYISGAKSSVFNYSFSSGNYTPLELLMYNDTNDYGYLDCISYNDDVYLSFCEGINCYLKVSSNKGESFGEKILIPISYYNQRKFAVDSTGIYYIWNDNILKFYNSSLPGISLTQVSSFEAIANSGGYTDMAMEGNNVYVSEFNGSSVRVISSNNKGAEFSVLGQFYMTQASNYGPFDLEVNGSNIYVAYGYEGNFFINISNNLGASFGYSIAINDPDNDLNLGGSAVNNDYYFINIFNESNNKNYIYRVSNSDFSYTVTQLNGFTFDRVIKIKIDGEKVYLFSDNFLYYSNNNGNSYDYTKIPWVNSPKMMCVDGDNINLFFESEDYIYYSYNAP
jgi:hypothetical protein